MLVVISKTVPNLFTLPTVWEPSVFCSQLQPVPADSRGVLTPPWPLHSLTVLYPDPLRSLLQAVCALL